MPDKKLWHETEPPHLLITGLGNKEYLLRQCYELWEREEEIIFLTKKSVAQIEARLASPSPPDTPLFILIPGDELMTDWHLGVVEEILRWGSAVRLHLVTAYDELEAVHAVIRAGTQLVEC